MKKDLFMAAVGYFRKLKVKMMSDPDEYCSGCVYTEEDASIEEILDF